MRETKAQCFTQAEIAAWKPRRVGNNTYRFERPARLGELHTHTEEVIRLHHTDIVVKDRKGRVTLYSGGYRTVTTKDRINRFTPYRVYSLKGQWYVMQSITSPPLGKPVPFYEGMVLPDAFEKAVKPNKAVREEEKLRGQIKRMLAKLDRAPALPQPSLGDCFFCQTALGSGATSPQFGDCVKSHLAETYLHGSLIARAVQARGYGSPSLVWGLATEQWPSYKRQFKRDLKRFLCQAVGV